MQRLLLILLLMVLAAGVARAQAYTDALWIKSGDAGSDVLAVTPDGRTLVSGSADGLKVWDIARRSLIRRMDTTIQVVALAISPDGASVAIAGGHNIDVYEITTGRLAHHLVEESTIYWSVCYSHDGRYLAAGGYGGLLRVWDATAGSLYAELAGHTDQVMGVAFSPTGDTLASGSYDCRVLLWNIPKKRLLTTYLYDGRPISTLTYAPDGAEVAFGTQDNVVKIIDLEHGTGMATLTINQPAGTLAGLCYSPDSRIIAFGLNGKVQLFYRNTSRLGALDGPVGIIVYPTFSADGAKLYAGYDGTILIWDAETWKFDDFLTDFNYGVSSVAFSPDSRWIAGYGTPPYTFVYDSETGLRRNTLWGPNEFAFINDLAFSPDSHDLAASTGNAIYIWDLDRDTMRTILTIGTRPLGWLAYSPDGRRIAVATDSGMLVCDAVTGAVIREWSGPEFPTGKLAYSPDGSYLATNGTGNMVRLWNVETGALEDSFGPLDTSAVRTEFSQDGTLLASGLFDGEVVVHRIADGKLLQTFHHHDMVTGVGFMPDGRRLVSGSLDSTIIVWDIVTGDITYSYTSYPSSVVGIAVSPNGDYIGSATYDALIMYRAPGGMSGVAVTSAGISKTSLEPGAPNPTSDQTSIGFTLDGSSEVTTVPVHLALFDPLGHEVRSLIDAALIPGHHVVEVDCRGLASGLYFYRLSTSSGVQVRELRIVH